MFKIEEITIKSNQTEATYENLMEKLNTTRNTKKSLQEQLSESKELIKIRDMEIKNLKIKLEAYEKEQVNSNEGWNKEVRNLDARINDVLGKIKEREILLTNYDDWERKYRDLEKTHADLLKKLNDEQSLNDKLKLNIKNLIEENEQIHNKQQVLANRKLSLQDFDDDLGKVLMSKEEVITQLEKSLADKDKCIQHLTKQLNDQLLFKNNEIDRLKDELERLNGYIDDLDKECGDLRGSNETYKNEIDFFQEEIKTFEFKLAHSQKELNDYKNLLDTSLRTQKKPVIQSIEIQTDTCLFDIEKELNEAKEENMELSEHLYALDEFMHDKEMQNEELEDKVKTLQNDNNDLIEANKILKEKYEDLLKNEQQHKQQINLQDKSFDYKKIIQTINEIIREFKLNLAQFKSHLKKFNDFYTQESQLNLNSQIITYMTEQMIHKAALNGHLKFACELLRKKCSDNLILIPNKNSLAKLNTSNTPNLFIPTSPLKQQSQQQQQQPSNDNDNNQNNLIKKLLKITSDLLLCDEDSLRKLSTQVLHEAEHLDQLNMVISALRKIRSKQFSSFNNDLIKQVDVIFNKTQRIYLNNNINELGCDNTNKYLSLDDNESDLNDVFIDDNSENDLTIKLNNKMDNLNYILNVMSEIYAQHKVQVCEQLNEVHKLMAISSDDDLFTHLQ